MTQSKSLVYFLLHIKSIETMIYLSVNTQDYFEIWCINFLCLNSKLPVQRSEFLL